MNSANPHSWPMHIWLLILFFAIFIGYYIRPDPVTVDLLKAAFGALLLALRTGPEQRPPAPQNENLPQTTIR